MAPRNRALIRCQCEDPKPFAITEERFAGLFTDTPLELYTATICDRCAGSLTDWKPVKP